MTNPDPIHVMFKMILRDPDINKYRRISRKGARILAREIVHGIRPFTFLTPPPALLNARGDAGVSP
jgi:hypothetical protein